MTHPEWCAYPDTCRGEHADNKTFVGATGGRPAEITPEGGCAYPVVGVGLDYSERDDPAPQIVLWLTGVAGVDQDVLLRLSEAEALVEALQARLSTLRAPAPA